MSEGSFEAKLTAKRETAAGIYLTVQVQPEDYQAELATLRVGSTMMLGWAEIVNTAVEPIELARTHGPQPESPIPLAKPNADKAEPHKERKPFASLPLSQQAALRCQDEMFEQFIAAGIGWHYDAETVAEWLRQELGVTSRSELDDEKNEIARDSWRDLEAGYQGFLTDQRYAGARR